MDTNELTELIKAIYLKSCEGTMDDINTFNAHLTIQGMIEEKGFPCNKWKADNPQIR